VSCSGNYREDGRAWEAGMKRNNGVLYISIGPELVLPNRQSYLHIFLQFFVPVVHHLSQTVNRFMCLFTFPEVTDGFLTVCEDFNFMAKQKIHCSKWSDKWRLWTPLNTDHCLLTSVRICCLMSMTKYRCNQESFNEWYLRCLLIDVFVRVSGWISLSQMTLVLKFSLCQLLHCSGRWVIMGWALEGFHALVVVGFLKKKI